MQFEIYKDQKSEWRWRLRAVNGNILAVSSEGYVHKADCETCISIVKNSQVLGVKEVPTPEAK